MAVGSYQDVTSHLQHSSKLNVTRATQRVFGMYVLVMIALFAILAIPMHDLAEVDHETIFNSVIGLMIFCSIQIGMILHLKKPLKWFGFHIGLPKKHLFEALGATAGFCGFITVLKYALIKTVPVLHSLPLFEFGRLTDQGVHHFSPVVMLYAMIYIMFCPLQAFLINGAFQGAVLHLFKGRFVKELSIVGATLLFAMIHLSIDMTYALAMLVPGLFWAIMYMRQKSLLGVSVSHMIIGLWALYALGFEHMFKLLGTH